MIGISFKELFFELKHYFTTAPDIRYTLGIVVVSLIVAYVLAIVFIKTTYKKETPNFRCRIGIIYSLLATLFVLFSYSVYHTKFTSLIVSNRLQPLLITLVLLSILGLIYIYRSAFASINKRGQEILTVKEGPIELEKVFLAKRLLLLRTKRLSFALLLPLLLLFITPSSKYLYSIIFDNSSSMEEQITLAQTYFENTSEKIKDNSIFVVTSFPRCQTELECLALQKRLSTNITMLTSNDPSKLVAETFVINRKADLMDYLQNGSLNIANCGSPIYEAIWQNFLSSIESSQNQSITKKKLIILSDGEDNLYRADLGFTKPKSCLFDLNYGDITMNDFFDEISLIKYNGNGTANISSSCVDMNIYEGNDAASFKKSFLEQIEDIYFDKYFLIIVSILLLVGILSIQTLK